MTFQVPVSVEEVLLKIHQKQYLLPAIQREFVWKPAQILALVDSLMRGYPIGSFLLWEVSSESASNYVFYDFITNFHEQKAPFATKAAIPFGQSITAVLDGQQRLTALNIALYGSHAEKKKGGWASNSDAYPVKKVYLNLLESPEDEELGFEYDVRFLTAEEAKAPEGEVSPWFLVGDILRMQDSGPSIMLELEKRNLTGGEPFGRLYRLYEAIKTTKPINWYLENSQDADKVLDIFVRVNSGGTTLSYSDLLLSMATNQWQTKDAREEVRSLVQEINQGGSRDFNFSKDTVLKSSLMISGLPVGFKVSNFTRENMAIVEQNWEKSKESLLIASALLRQFGFSTRTISADSVLIVLAYYIAANGLSSSYIDSSGTSKDREVLKSWLLRTLLKQGIWGSGLDTLLTRIRSAISANRGPAFPSKAIEEQMSLMGKNISFEQSDIDDVLNLKYGSARTFAALAIIYPGLDLTKEFHQDHIFPKSKFTDSKLRELGVPPEQFEEYKSKFDLLPNLQLLAGTANSEKLAKIPDVWVSSAFATDDLRQTYLRENDLWDLALDFNSFNETFEARKSRIAERLKVSLGITP